MGEAPTRERRSQAGEEAPTRGGQLLSRGAHCWGRPRARLCVFLEETSNSMKIGQRTEETRPNQAGGGLRMKNWLLFAAEGAICSKQALVKASTLKAGQLRHAELVGIRLEGLTQLSCGFWCPTARLSKASGRKEAQLMCGRHLKTGRMRGE